MVWYLRDIRLDGSREDTSAVHEFFGDIRISGEFWNSASYGSPYPPNFGEHAFFFTVKRFSNFYRDSSGKASLYFLVPNRVVYNIWPETINEYDDIKFGAVADKTGKIITRGVVFHLNRQRISLYICTSPEAIKLQDGDSFGI